MPRIAWGRVVERDDAAEVALSIQAHHALVDGLHLARFFARFEALAARPEHWLGG